MCSESAYEMPGRLKFYPKLDTLGGITIVNHWQAKPDVNMLRNYLTIALRNLQRQFSYSLINILGLAIGIACSLVIFLYVYAEWSYDRHFKHADRIYKVGISFFNIGQFGLGPEALGDFLPKEFEGIEAFTRIKRVREVPVYLNGQSFNELIYYTDTSFFKVFAYEFIEGDRRTALEGTSGLVMTQRMANKYFNDGQAMGKILAIGKDKKLFTVTGIVKDDDRSSQFKTSLWLSIDSELPHDPTWTSAATYNYMLLKENQGQQDLEAALDRLLEKQVYPHASGVPQDISFEDYKKNENAVKFYVHPLIDIHLKSKLNYEISPGGNESNMYTFAAISVFILLLASVNFINLTTARASRRAKEVGIRKAIGSTRGKLVMQFTLESVLLSLAALALSLAMAELFLKAFEMITGNQLLNTLWTNGWSILILLVFGVVVGLLSGIYPALYLTSFKPVKVLKGNLESSGGGGFRNLLVVFQFSISICLMLCSTIIVRQMNFMQTKDLGFNQENVVTIDGISELGTGVEAFRNELAQQAGVSKVSLHTGEPGSKAIMTFNTFQTPAMQDAITVSTYFGDHEFVDLMGFHIVKGRGFNKELASDSAGVMLNESAVKALGLEDPIGAEVNKGQRVIGVVSNFHWESLRNTIAPVAIMLGNNYYQMGFRINGANAHEFLQKAETRWNKLLPNEPMKFHFLDANFGELLEKEKMFGKAIGFFTALAIFISCLGLYGLSAYTAEQRTKEIGIRKVLGASASNILAMLNKKFAMLVFIAIFIATPVSYYVMTKWIEGFAYRVELQLWIFLSSIALALVIALATVSYHSLKAALINPADTLKYE